MDWGDACVSHPFFTLSVTLEGVLAWGLDDVEDSGTPRRSATPTWSRSPSGTTATWSPRPRVATRLGWACRAVNGHVPGDDKQTVTRLRMFLDGRPD